MLWIHSQNQDPGFNLALEEYLVRRRDNFSPILLTYYNRTCVVLGKHQNVFKEVNLKYCDENDIPIYRRISGGGAVYHDLGNLNIAYIVPFDQVLINNYYFFNTPQMQALKDFGIDTGLNERNSLVTQKDQLKVSGNAQFTNRRSILSHSTLLIHSNLTHLENILHHQYDSVESKSTASIQSKVTNLKTLRTVNPNELLKALVQEAINHFKTPKTELNLNPDEVEDVNQLKVKYDSLAWRIQKSSKCTIRKKITHCALNFELSIEVDQGVIQKIEPISSTIPNWLKGIQGKTFELESLKVAIKKEGIDDVDALAKQLYYINE